MTDTSPTPPTGSGQFCGECGAALLPDATFCGECGAATSLADADGPDTDAPDEAANGASKWDDVDTVVEPPTGPATVPVPNVPPPPGPAGPPGGAPPTGPPTGGPPPGAAEPDEKAKGKGPKVLIVLLVLAALIGGAFVFLGGDDGGGDDDAAIDRDEDEDDEDPDDETTTAPDDEETTTTAPDDTTTAPAVGFVNLVDDTGRISVDVPNDWLDISRAPADGLPRILAAPDAQAFETGFNVPGVDVRLIDSPPPPEQFDSSLDTVAESIGLPASCTSQGKQDYAEGAFTGRIEVWAECAGVGTQMALVFAQQADGQTVFIGLQLTTSDDPIIADQVSASVAITG